MPEQQIGNPVGAYGETLEAPAAQAPGFGYVDAYNAGATAIPVNTWVGLDITGTGSHVFGVTKGLHGAAAKTAIGIAIDTIAPGAVGRVVVRGPASAIAGTGGVTAGDLLTIDPNASHDGQLITDSASPPVVATVLGMALTTAAAGAAVEMWVFKC